MSDIQENINRLYRVVQSGEGRDADMKTATICFNLAKAGAYRAAFDRMNAVPPMPDGEAHRSIVTFEFLKLLRTDPDLGAKWDEWQTALLDNLTKE